MKLSIRHVFSLLAFVLALGVSAAGASAATWSALTLPNPPNVTNGQLYGISCFSGTVCNAPGQGDYGDNGAIAETLNGSTWTPAAGVKPNNGQKNGILWGADCPLETMCMTVGSYGSSSGQKPWAQRQVTSAWTMWPPGLGVPAGATRAELKDVSCTSSSWCIATGWKMVWGDDKPWAARFNGNEWFSQAPVENGNATLNGVSCVSQNYCLAVGFTGNVPLAQVWNGTSWSAPAAQPPVPGGWKPARLDAVHCVSASWCMATGSMLRVEEGKSYWRPFADIWDGSAWKTTLQVPWGNNLEALAYGISCLSESECWIAGEGHWGSQLKPWSVRWTGTTWESQSIPLASGTVGGQLRDISCYASFSCKASGWSVFANGSRQPLIETVAP